MGSVPETASHIDTCIQSSSYPLYLRTVRLADAPLHASLLSDPLNGGDPSAPITAERSREIIARQRQSASQPTVIPDPALSARPSSGPSRVNMALCLRQAGSDGPKDDDPIIGLGGFGAIHEQERAGCRIRAGDAGVLLDSAFRGKGFGVEAMRLAIGWAFTAVSVGGPQLDLVTVTTGEENAAMLRMAEERLGLRGKGVLRPAEFDRTRREVYYEITPEDWTAFLAR